MSQEKKEGAPWISDLAGLAKLSDSKLANKLYDDLLSSATAELGETLKEIVAGLRLFNAPLMLAAAWHKRLKTYCDEVISRVPEARRVEAPPEIAGNILQSLTFLPEDNPLKELYLNLLARAIDRERQNEAHPAFVRIIDQLSPEEAMLLWRYWRLCVKRAIITMQECTLHEEGYVSPPPSPSVSIPKALTRELRSPELCEMYIEHCMSLNLVVWKPSGVGINSLKAPDDEVGRLEEYEKETNYYLAFTRFGGLFIRACMPERFPSLEKRQQE